MKKIIYITAAVILSEFIVCQIKLGFQHVFVEITGSVLEQLYRVEKGKNRIYSR